MDGPTKSCSPLPLFSLKGKINMSGATLRNNTDQHRYELVADDQVVGFTEYESRSDMIVLRHTEVAAGHEGKGYGSTLAKQALDDVIAQGKKVAIRCEFIAAYVKRHPEYAPAIVAK